MTFSPPKCAALIRTQIEKFNASVFREMNEMFGVDQSSPKFAQDLEAHMILNPADAYIICDKLNGPWTPHFENDVQFLKREKPSEPSEIIMGPEGYPIRPPSNSIILTKSIALNGTIQVRIVFKQNVQYSGDLRRPDLIPKGAQKVIKTRGFELVLTDQSEGTIISSTPIATWGRVATLGAGPLTRPQKMAAFKSLIAAQETAVKDFTMCRYIDNYDQDVIIFYQPYYGPALINLVTKGTNFGRLEPKFKTDIIFLFLKDLHRIILEKVWPSDLKLHNMCINRDFETGALQIRIIDYADPLLTVILFKTCTAGTTEDDVRCVWRGLTEIKTGDKAKISDDQFCHLRHQLIFEILNVLFVMDAWPQISCISSALHKQFMPSTFEMWSVLTNKNQQESIRFFVQNRFHFLLLQFVKDILNPNRASRATWTFTDFLRFLGSSFYATDLPSWFTLEWRRDFGLRVDNFRTF